MEGTKCKEIPSLKKKEKKQDDKARREFFGKKGDGPIVGEGGIIISCTKVMVRRKEFGG